MNEAKKKQITEVTTKTQKVSLITVCKKVSCKYMISYFANISTEDMCM